MIIGKLKVKNKELADDFTNDKHQFTNSTTFLDAQSEISSNESRVPLDKNDTYT